MKKKKSILSFTKRRLESNQYPEFDETFAFIVGYTAWGFPHGVTWEEMERIADEVILFDSMPPEERCIKFED
jgi:hypothetical protein